MRIALTGGIACGKSLLANYLNELGVETLDADDIVHELIPEPERRRIADEIFRDPAKRKELEQRIHPLVRARLAEAVGKRECSQIAIDTNVHKSQISISGGAGAAPAMTPCLCVSAGDENSKLGTPNSKLASTRSTRSTRLNSQLGTRNSQLPTIEIIPLLFECHWEADYDIILCVSSPRSLQVERMTSRRGYTEEQAESRLAAQLPVEEKAARSDYVIENGGSAENLMEEAKKLVAWLKGKCNG